MSEAALLSHHRLYEGTDVDDARKMLSRIFTESDVDPVSTRAPYSALVNGLELPRISVTYCEYRHGMIADVKAPLSFHSIQLPVSGNTEFFVDGKAITCGNDKGLALSANEKVRLRHGPGSAVLSLIVPDEVMEDVLTTVAGRTGLPALRFAGPIDLASPSAASLMQLMKLFVSELDRPGGILQSPAAVASFEDALIKYMLFALDHNLKGKLQSSTSVSGDKQVRFVEEYITAHAAEPITMETIAQITGQSAKAIYRAFRRYRNHTPLQFLHKVRLDNARQRLLRPQASDNVSRIAMECGFIHVGRFSVEYRRRFGESPKDTLKFGVKLNTDA